MGGPITLDPEVLLAPVVDVPILECNFDLADSHLLHFHSLRDILSGFLLTVAVEPRLDLVLITPDYMVWSSADAAVVFIVVSIDKLGEDLGEVSFTAHQARAWCAVKEVQMRDLSVGCKRSTTPAF